VSPPARNAFAADAIAPETRRFNEALEKQLAAAPPVHTLPPQVIREARERGEGIWGEVPRLAHARTRTCPGPAGEIPLRILRARDPRGVFLHFHGGGWTLGAAHHSDVALDRIARETGLTAVSAGYRLAPEHPYPAGPDDCEAAALWLLEHAEAELGAPLVAIGGESAGAHLSVVTMLRLRDSHRARPFRAASLVYGSYDLAFTPSVRRWGERNLVLSTPIIEWFTDHFVPPELRGHPDVSPLHADLSGLPPALFSVGTLDPLLDDTLFMEARWRAAGNDAELAIYPGGVHGFNAFPFPLAEQANARVSAFLGARAEPR
jgi:acetyl esterase